MLFDEFIAFAHDKKLDIEKDPLIVQNYKKPRKVY